MHKLADFIINKRGWFLAIITIISLFFLYLLKDLRVYTRYADLLPQQHEYIKLHNKIRSRLGGANTVTMILQVKKGDIFNAATLQKIRDITDELYLIPAVDRFKVLSISVNLLLDMVATSGGFDFMPLMFPDVPKTEDTIETLREKVYASAFYGSFVWFDSKKTLITADFFEDEIDYRVVFKELLRIQQKYEDDNHLLSINGEPMHLGYVDFYTGTIFLIMLGTTLVMLMLFYYWYRSLRATLIPFLGAVVSGVWGLGFMCLLGYNLDPLILVFPFLIASRAACHTVQVIKRYTEECLIAKEPKAACKRVIEGMFIPGFTAIITDAMGIILIALTPIQILQKITIACTFWCIAQIIIATVLVPIVLSYLPISARLLEKFSMTGVLDRVLVRLGEVVGGRRNSLAVFGVVGVLAVSGYLGARNIQVGDATPGSSLFWPWHRYNQDGFRIAFSMPILSPLYVVMEGEQQWDLLTCPGKPRGECGGNLEEIYRLQKFMRETPDNLVMFVDSIITTFESSNSLMHEADPNWAFFPTQDREIAFLYTGVRDSGIPGSADRYCDAFEEISANIIVYCRDKTTSTIKAVMERVEEFIRNQSGIAPPLRYKLAGGAVGVQAAVNEVIEHYHNRTLGWALLAIFLTCWIMFRSVIAALMLTIPLIVSNLIAYAMMATGLFYLLPVPITITQSTLPVSAVGIGLGVDYGIYMLGRIMEECRVRKDLKEAIKCTMASVGEPIVFTTLAMTVGLIIWVFSPLMFQASMGFFLATILILNMLGGLFLVPCFVSVIKPGFVVRQR